MHESVRLIGFSKLDIGVQVSVNGCLSLFGSPLMSLGHYFILIIAQIYCPKRIGSSLIIIIIMINNNKRNKWTHFPLLLSVLYYCHWCSCWQLCETREWDTVKPILIWGCHSLQFCKGIQTVSFTQKVVEIDILGYGISETGLFLSTHV